MKRILLLYTGGTIGCEGEPLAPMSLEHFAQRLGAMGLLRSACELRALPRPLDSASMQPADWLDIRAALLAAWADFDGFVVLHGTDTLAYTAAALSFLLPGIDKPLVITGSQHPLAAMDSDAPGNLSDAIAVAGQSALYEVVVCFAGRVLRGNRSVKRSASELDAFESPNWPDLGNVLTGGISLNPQATLPAPSGPFQAAPTVSPEQLAGNPVWLVHLHPGFPAALLHAALALPLAPRGWVLACYGVGNAPDNPEFLSALQRAQEQGVVVVAVTQTGQGTVDLQTYEAGTRLAAAGVISGRDLSLPAAVVRLQLLLAAGASRDEIATAISSPLAGEMR